MFDNKVMTLLKYWQTPRHFWHGQPNSCSIQLSLG